MDWLSTIIGAAIGFVSSIGIIVVQRLFERAGRLEIYAKVVYDRPTGSHTWGFRNGRDGITLNVPIWIEIQNLSNSARILRDINLLLVSEGKDVAAMTQINRAGSKDSGEYLYANEGNYSLSVEGREIKRIVCYFSLKFYTDVPNFDEIKLRYFDEKNQPRKFSLGKVEGDWKIKEFPRNEEWIKLREDKKRGRNSIFFHRDQTPSYKIVKSV